jgi:hypothetical protein
MRDFPPWCEAVPDGIGIITNREAEQPSEFEHRCDRCPRQGRLDNSHSSRHRGCSFSDLMYPYVVRMAVTASPVVTHEEMSVLSSKNGGEPVCSLINACPDEPCSVRRIWMQNRPSSTIGVTQVFNLVHTHGKGTCSQLIESCSTFWSGGLTHDAVTGYGYDHSMALGDESSKSSARK